jgi:hypothetical protein
LDKGNLYGTTVAGGAAGYGTFADEPVVHEGSRAVHVRGQMAIGLAGHHGAEAMTANTSSPHEIVTPEIVTSSRA